MTLLRESLPGITVLGDRGDPAPYHCDTVLLSLPRRCGGPITLYQAAGSSAPAPGCEKGAKLRPTCSHDAPGAV
jgi:hypothetical protein